MLSNIIHNEKYINLDPFRKNIKTKLEKKIRDGVYNLIQNNICYCGSDNFEKLSNIDRFGLEFGTKICCDCGLISQIQSFDEISMSHFYDDIYWPLHMGNLYLNTYTQTSSLSEFLKFIKPTITNTFSNKKNLKVYELGCGDGLKLRTIKDVFKGNFNIFEFGVDYSTDAVNNAKKNNLNVSLGGLDEFIKKDQCDIFIMSHILEHILDLKQALKIIYKILKDDGLLYIEVPGVKNLQYFREYLYNYQDYCTLAHTYNFSLETLTSVLNDNKFEVVKGNQYVQSIFKKNHNTLHSFDKTSYKTIISSLIKAKYKNEKYENSYLTRGKRFIKKMLINK